MGRFSSLLFTLLLGTFFGRSFTALAAQLYSCAAFLFSHSQAFQHCSIANPMTRSAISWEVSAVESAIIVLTDAER
jgi:hypothetical protein